MSDKVVYLAFSNEKNCADDGKDVLACNTCRNKTYILRTDLGIWPEVYCACCGARIGASGWAEQERI